MKGIIGIVCIAVVAAPLGAVDLKTVAVNRWTTLYTGSVMTRVHPSFVWLPDRQEGFLWPNLNFHAKAVSFEQHAVAQFFSPAKGAWEGRPTQFGETDRMRPAVVGPACVWLPGLKRVLVVMTEDSTSRGEKAVSWLFDPETNAWEAVKGDVSTADDPTAYGATSSQGGGRIPLWGALVYDALNGEAVLVGGGATWGRVGKEKVKVGVGDWIYDEGAKRVRRLTPEDEGPPNEAADGGKVAQARKWYPANCGTWVFSEKTRQWRPIEQPLEAQPSGRIVPAAAYDPTTRRIVLFGGDDYVKCLNDTWAYDCAGRTWAQVRRAVSPPARAFAGMTAVPNASGMLLAGGYGPGWKALQDVWTYDPKANTWSKLAADLPGPAGCCSAAADAASGAVLVSWSDSPTRARRSGVAAMRLDPASAEKADVPPPANPRSTYHCKAATDWYVPLPDEWQSKKNKGLDPEVGRRELVNLPVNTWSHREPAMKARARQWGSYTYDTRTHTAYAWGGGHYGYVGNEVNEYSVLANRWISQVAPTAYKPRWWHGAGGGGGTQGVSFQGWRLMGVHARKSYAVDVSSNNLLNFHGEVYSLKHHMVYDNIGRCPGGYGLSQQETFLNTPHGLYAFGLSRQFGPVIHRADVANHGWELVAKGGPRTYDENDHVCYDSKRDRMIYFDSRTADVWTFDFETKTWSQDEPASAKPAKALGDSCYIPPLDAAFMIYATERRGAETLYFYRLDERKWYTSPYVGKAIFSKTTGRDASPFYDPELNLIVRVAHEAREGWIDVLILRLDPKALPLSEVK